MSHPVAVIGAGVAGLTTAVALAEDGFEPVIFAESLPMRTTSAVAAAVWFPYDAEPESLVSAWALITYGRLLELARRNGTGVSLIDFEYRSVQKSVPVPHWAEGIGYRPLAPSNDGHYRSGFAVTVPLMDTTRYLGYLQERAGARDEAIRLARLDSIDEIPSAFPVIVNCSGYGARALVADDALEPHRGQVVVVDGSGHQQAFVLDEPLTYVIPRASDCILGGTNVVSSDLAIDDAATEQIVSRCTPMMDRSQPPTIRQSLVGIRPARRGGVRLCASRSRDGRFVVHNYGHGGCGLSLSWGCAQKVVSLVRTSSS